jgi:hypothetical protein
LQECGIETDGACVQQAMLTDAWLQGIMLPERWRGCVVGKLGETT